MLGEETVLLKALEGKRGQPEQRPPHPAERGLFGQPTVVQNVADPGGRALDPRHGAEAFAAIGDAGSPGTVLVQVRGAVATPGSPRSRRGRRSARSCARRRRRRRPRSSRRCSSAGPSGGLLPADLLDTPYDVRALREAGRPRRVGLGRRRRRAGLRRGPGPAADARSAPTRRAARRSPAGSARAGSPRSATGIATGGPRPTDLEAPRRPQPTTSSRSALCDHERLATLPFASAMRYFRSELDDHILRSTCPAGVCHPIAVAAGAASSADDAPMADLITRPDTARRPSPSRSPTPRRALLTTQAPQRPQSTPRIRIEVDGRVVEGLEGQTILEVCRDNGIEIPTLCYEPKLPGFGACRMCVVEVEGEEHPPISLLAGRRGRDEGPDPDRGGPPPAPDQPRADLLATTTPTACRPARTSARATSTSRASSRQNAEGELARVDPDLQADDPVPVASSAASARRRARSTAGATRWTRRSPSATRHRYAGDQVLKAMLDDGRRPAGAVRDPAADRPPGRGHRVRPGRRGGGLLPADRRPRRHGLRARPGAGRDAPLRHPAVPPAEGRGPRGRVRGGHPARRADRLRPGASAATSPSTTSRTRASTRSCVAIGCYDTNKLGIPGEDADGVHRRPRVPPDGDPRPDRTRATPGTRVVVIGGGFTSMDCSRTSVRQGAAEVTLVYRRDMKDMPAAERGPRGDRGRRHGDLPGRPDARRRRRGDGKVTGVEFIRMQLGEPDASRPAPPGAGARARSSRSPATGSCSRSARGPTSPGSARAPTGPQATKQRRLQADAVTFETGRPGVFGTGDVRDRRGHRRPGDRRGPTRGLRGRRLPQGPRPRRDPDPPDAGRAAARVPLDRARSRARSRSRATASRRWTAEVRNRSYVEYEIPYTPAEAVAESTRCLQCTCEAIGFCDLRRLGIEYGTTLPDARAAVPPGRRLPLASPRTASPATTTTTSATTATPSSCASRRAASTAAAAPRSARRSSGRRATTSCGSASTRS